VSADTKGILISYGFLFGIVFLGEAVRAIFKFKSVFTRKFIHIGVGFWGLVAYGAIQSTWAVLIPPVSFVLINLISYKWTLIKSMEIEDKSNLGTVYYPLALCLLLLFFWQGNHRVVPIIGLLVMGLGDGFASIIGEAWGKHRYRAWGKEKSWEGSAAMFVFSLLAVITVLFLFTEVTAGTIFFRGCIIALLATVVEGASPWGTDNLTVPILSGVGYWLLF
jgi:dolichol kinase